jgi:hypothetical protein
MKGCAVVVPKSSGPVGTERRVKQIIARTQPEAISAAGP